MMLFFREGDGDAKVVDTSYGPEASRMKRMLLKQGYKEVFSAPGFFAVEYVTYKCRSCNKYEIFYAEYSKEYGIPVYKSLGLSLMGILQDCKYERYLPTERHSFRLSKPGYKELFLEIIMKLNEAGREDEIKALMSNAILAGKVVAKMYGMKSLTVEDILDAIASVALEDAFKGRDR
jgi:hypothetical protein